MQLGVQGPELEEQGVLVAKEECTYQVMVDLMPQVNYVELNENVPEYNFLYLKTIDL